MYLSDVYSTSDSKNMPYMCWKCRINHYIIVFFLFHQVAFSQTEYSQMYECPFPIVCIVLCYSYSNLSMRLFRYPVNGIFPEKFQDTELARSLIRALAPLISCDLSQAIYYKIAFLCHHCSVALYRDMSPAMHHLHLLEMTHLFLLKLWHISFNKMRHLWFCEAVVSGNTSTVTVPFRDDTSIMFEHFQHFHFFKYTTAFMILKYHISLALAQYFGGFRSSSIQKQLF